MRMDGPEHDKLRHNINWVLSEAAKWIEAQNKIYNEDNINEHFIRKLY